MIRIPERAVSHLRRLKTMRVCLLIVVSLIAAIAACAQGSIREVDFKNFNYAPYCIGETPGSVTVKDGEFFEEKQEDGYVDRFYFRVYDAVFGDLNGDGREDAVVISVCNTGGTGNFTEGFVYGLSTDKKPVLLARIPGGDRAYGGLRSAVVEKGILIVESNDVGELGGACCPEVIVKTRYRLAGNNLTVIGAPERREIFPSERLTFAKGATGKTFKVKLPPDEGKRFIVGAKAGQVMDVSVSSESGSLRLLEDAKVTFGINNFRAVLPKSGNYTIEIRNDSESELEVTINVKIL
jgi:hypothetical protein